MAKRSRALNPGILIPIGIVAALIGVIAWSRKRRREDFPTIIEYWVYLPAAQLPPQEQLMTAVVGDNPHSKPGKPAISGQQGMLFTDIRTNLVLAKRSRNPHIFRPDLFESNAEPTEEILERLSSAQAIAKVSFISEVPVEDQRHLQFIPQMADAISRLCGGVVVYDRIAERLYTSEEFFQMLERQPDVTGTEFHLRVLWKPSLNGGSAETRGLQKIGAREIQTDEAPSDQESLICSVVSEAASKVWSGEKASEKLEVPLYGDNFILSMRREAGNPALRTHIHRVSTSSPD